MQPGDAEALVADMREQDAAECAAGGEPDLLAIVRKSIAASECFAAVNGGTLVAVFGVAPAGTALAPLGVPWLLGTTALVHERRALVRLSRLYIHKMLNRYPHLLNVVHARNTVAVRWLRRVGFTLHPAQPLAPTGEPFHLFEMRA